MKAAVPSGYMISTDSKTISVKICNGLDNSEQTIEIPMASDSGEHERGTDQSGEACSSSSFSKSTMTATDPIQLTLALAFIMLVGLTTGLDTKRDHTAHLRPPLRGPPVSL
ncbi:hypothetical protein GCM10009096_10320 [Parasphingorhabdus litoris]|uniref:Uncharacterized protein n=2 Tax=Parasphingorhabdus litoris TaxID=394733 RepID=A0ABN1AA03_9SPHN